jgi:methyl-accepting chemotaxis protein
MIDFQTAKSKHALWGLKLSTFLGGNSDQAPLEIMSDHDCALGKWLYSEGLNQYGHLAEIKALQKEHKNLHEIGLHIVALKHQSRIAEAQQELEKIAPLSQSILKHLEHLETQIKH